MTDTLHMTLQAFYESRDEWDLVVNAVVGEPYNEEVRSDIYDGSLYISVSKDEPGCFEVGTTSRYEDRPISLPATTPVTVTLYPDSKWQDCLERARALREKYGESKKQDAG